VKVQTMFSNRRAFLQTSATVLASGTMARVGSIGGSDLPKQPLKGFAAGQSHRRKELWSLLGTFPGSIVLVQPSLLRPKSMMGTNWSTWFSISTARNPFPPCC